MGNNLDRRLWLRSAAYQKGYKHGRADGSLVPAPAVIRLRMEDGRVLLTDAVIAELRKHGFDIVPYAGSA